MKKLLALLLAMAMILTLTACGGDKDDDKGVANKPEEVAKAFVKAELYNDVKELKGLWAYDYEAMIQDETLDEYGTEEDFFEEAGEEYGEDINSWNDAYAMVKKLQKEYMEERYGKGFKVTVSADKSIKMDEDELDDLIDDLKDEYEGYVNRSDLNDVQEGVIVPVTIVIKGDNQEQEQTYGVYVIKLGKKWKVADYERNYEPPQADDDDDDYVDDYVGDDDYVADSTTTTITPPRPQEATTTTEAPDVMLPDPNAYNVGYIDYNDYVNHWANLCCTINNGWEQGTEEDYATYENSTTECGLYIKRFNDATGAYDLINIVYEYMQGADYTATDYMTLFTYNLKSTYDSMGYTVEATDPVELRHEGRVWIDCTISLPQTALYQRYLVAEQDGYMIIVIFTTKDSAQLDDMIYKVKALG